MQKLLQTCDALNSQKMLCTIQKSPRLKQKWFFAFLIFLIISATRAVCQPFPEVHLEPFHQPTFESDYFRILHVDLNVGDTSAFHNHCTPILYLTVQGTEMWLQSVDMNQRSVELPSGWIGSDLYHSDSCFTHRIANIGESQLILRAVQLKRDITLPSLPDFEFSAAYSENGFKVAIISPGEFLAQRIPFWDVALLWDGVFYDPENEIISLGTPVNQTELSTFGFDNSSNPKIAVVRVERK